MTFYDPFNNQELPKKPKKDYVFEDTLQIFEQVVKDVSERTGKPKISTGIRSLDELTWGLHKKELMVIAARPSHGKSAIVHNLALASAKQGKKTVLLSIEMSRGAVVERLVCIEMGLQGWKLRKGFPDEIQKLKDQAPAMNSFLLKNPLIIIDSMGKNHHDVEQILEEHKPDVLLIDHIQKISPMGYKGKLEALADYANTLQTYAIDHDVAVVLASQINRSGEKEGNAMDNLKGSGDIEEVADVVLTCKWLWRSDRTHEDQKEFVITAEKQRHGPCDQITVNFNGATFKFTDRDHEFNPEKSPVTPFLIRKKERDWNG